MGRSSGVVTAPPAATLALFAKANPNKVFSHLEEIGHGNFGAVYQVCLALPSTSQFLCHCVVQIQVRRVGVHRKSRRQQRHLSVWNMQPNLLPHTCHWLNFACISRIWTTRPHACATVTWSDKYESGRLVTHRSCLIFLEIALAACHVFTVGPLHPW